MALESFEKQNYEEFFIGGDYVDVLESGEALSLAPSTVIAEDKDGNDVTSTVLEASTKALDDSEDGGTNNVLKIRCRAGVEASSPYKITFKGETTLANKWEIDVKMKIKEK
jgi:hypothetical protein